MSVKRYLRDFQRQRVYNWEDKFISNEAPLVTANEINSAFMQLRMAFRINEAQLSLEPNRFNYSYQLDYKIHLKDFHYKYPVLCHEFAHMIIYHEIEEVHGYPIAQHGEQFLTMYMILLQKSCGADLENMLRSAQDSKLKFFRDLVAESCEDK